MLKYQPISTKASFNSLLISLRSPKMCFHWSSFFYDRNAWSPLLFDLLIIKAFVLPSGIIFSGSSADSDMGDPVSLHKDRLQMRGISNIAITQSVREP